MPINTLHKTVDGSKTRIGYGKVYRHSCRAAHRMLFLEYLFLVQRSQKVASLFHWLWCPPTRHTLRTRQPGCDSPSTDQSAEPSQGLEDRSRGGDPSQAVGPPRARWCLCWRRVLWSSSKFRLWSLQQLWLVEEPAGDRKRSDGHSQGRITFWSRKWELPKLTY